jgi:hypothetical protein
MGPKHFFPNHPLWHEIALAPHADFLKKHPDGEWLTLLETAHQAKIFGGWLEDRSPLFDSRHTPHATIHLGIDFWLPATTPVFSPFEGEILLTKPKKSENGGWGGRIDLLTNHGVFTFGHLSLPIHKKGHILKKGDILGTLAPKSDNGGWLPHLHLQRTNTDYYLSLKHPHQMDAYAAPSSILSTLFPHPFLQI